MTRITLVKKRKADGNLCRKCDDVSRRLQRDGLAARIDRVVIADEREPEGLGMRLAREHDVDRAPFFLVTDDSSQVRVYTVYHRLVEAVLKRPVPQGYELVGLRGMHPELDHV